MNTAVIVVPALLAYELFMPTPKAANCGRDFSLRGVVIEQSWKLGKVLQLSNPMPVWLRNAVSRTKYAERQSQTLLEQPPLSAWQIAIPRPYRPPRWDADGDTMTISGEQTR